MFFQTKDERKTGYYDTEAWYMGRTWRRLQRSQSEMAFAWLNKLAPMDIMMLPVVYRGEAS